MSTATRYRVDPAKVVFETIDGETILISLDSGTYHSLAGAGTEIWDLLRRGWPADEVPAELRRRHPDSAPDLEEQVVGFTAELVERSLLDADDAPPERSDPAPAEAAGTFAPPVLRSYDDMQYFLLLDPVHEVADAGWPTRDVDAGRV